MNNEPVAWMHKTATSWVSTFIHPETEPDEWIPLYTHPVDAVNISEQYVDKSENNRHDLGIAEAIGFEKGYAAAQAKTQEPDCYGDGNVYRGVRSKDSETKTYVFDEHAGKQVWSNPAKTEDEPNWKEMYWWMHELNHKHWSELDALKTHPAKTLTDEEINELANKYLYVLNDVPYANDIKDFAKAILRKAQEK